MRKKQEKCKEKPRGSSHPIMPVGHVGIVTIEGRGVRGGEGEDSFIGEIGHGAVNEGHAASIRVQVNLRTMKRKDYSCPPLVQEEVREDSCIFKGPLEHDNRGTHLLDVDDTCQTIFSL